MRPDKCVRLGDAIADVQAGFPTSERDPTGVVQLRMNNVTTSGDFDWRSILRVPTALVNDELLLRPGDVLFNNTNSAALVGKSVLFRGHDEPITFSNHFTRLRTRPDRLLPEFLVLWLVSKWTHGEFERLCRTWIGQSAIGPNKLLDIPISLPALTNQSRIAACLGAQLAELARAQWAAESRMLEGRSLLEKTLEQTFENITGRITNVPLREVIKQRNEIVHPKNKPTGEAVFVGLEHIENGTGKRIGSLPLDKGTMTGRKATFAAGDIVYGYLRPYLNKVWIAEFEGLCSVDQYVYITDHDKAVPEFVAHYLRSPVFLRRAPIGTTPGQLPRIRTEEIDSTLIPLPPLPKQEEIVCRLNTVTREIEKVRHASRQVLLESGNLQRALLREAFA